MVERGHPAEARLAELGSMLGSRLSARFGTDWDDRLLFASGHQKRHQTFLAVRDFFASLPVRRPLVLIFDDLQWVDELSLDLLCFLIEALADDPVLILCAYRPGREHRCAHLTSFAPQKRPESFDEVRVKELSTPQMDQRLHYLLPDGDLPERFLERVYQQSKGNPLYVEKVVRGLIESGVARRREGARQVDDVAETAHVPETIESIALSRDRLDDRSKHLLQCASVVGKRFSQRMPEALLPDEPYLEQALWDLEDSAFVFI